MRPPRRSLQGMPQRQGRPVRVDFYNMQYGVPGSLAAHDRSEGQPAILIDALGMRIDPQAKCAYVKNLPPITLARDDPEVIFYCALEPDRQDHFCHLTRKVFFVKDNIAPDWRYADWGVSFDAQGERNFHMNSAELRPLPRAQAERAAPPPAPAAVLASKTKFCAFVYSEHHCASRIAFCERLSRAMRVDAAGRVLRSVGHAPPRDQVNFIKTVTDFYRPYKFVIAFENVRAPGYASEKIWTAFGADAVPIYLGDPHIAKRYNPEAFIHARDFDNLDSLARHVMRVHEDDALYLRYLSQPRLNEAQCAAARTHDARYIRFLRTALLTRPVGAYAPRAQRDGFLRETISRLDSAASARLMAAPELDLRPMRGVTDVQLSRIWQGETP